MSGYDPLCRQRQRKAPPPELDEHAELLQPIVPQPAPESRGSIVGTLVVLALLVAFLAGYVVKMLEVLL